MKKLAVYALILSLLATAFCSCASKTGGTASTDTTAQAVETEADTRIYPDLPANDFDGYTFRLAHWEVSGWNWIECDMDIDEDTGDVIESGLFNRNRNIEDKYNCTIEAEYLAHDVIVRTLQNTVSAADDAYDVFFIRGYEIQNALNTKCMYDMSKLDYIDFTKPWWDSNSVEEFSLGGRVFFAVSDIQLTDKMATASVMFNKQVQADFNIGNLYQLVYDNTWTVDKMLELTAGIAADLNGNGEVDINDRFGILSQNDYTYFMLHGADTRYCAKDEDDLPVFSFGTERDIAVSNKIVDVMTDHANFYNGHTDGGDYRQMFAANQGLFFIERLSLINDLRNMEADFGVLPIPKFDETQKNYGHSVSKHTTGLMCVPLSLSDPDRTGFFLEALASESKYTLLPAYYDIALKDKYTRDVESTDMLDLIFSTRVFDLGEFYSFGGFSDKYLYIGQDSGNRNIASMVASSQKAVDAGIKKVVKLLDSYAG